MTISQQLAAEFGLKQEYSDNIIGLIDEGCTIPFIARYRKEQHGTCDDQVLQSFSDRLTYLRNLTKEKEKVQKTIEEQGKWTPELAKALENARTLTEVEDIYRPYKPKRKTRASVAIAKGLQPLADIILKQNLTQPLTEIAVPYVDAEKEVKTVKDALQGASDIIAEMISDDAEQRKELRIAIRTKGFLSCTLLDNEKNLTYETYKEFKQEIEKVPSHRVLAINRGENENCLKVSIDISEKITIPMIEREFKKDCAFTNEFMDNAIADSYSRLLFPSLEREARNELTDMANEQGIKMFASNLQPLLMQPPLKDKVIMGFDPAYRTGCKIAVIDKNGSVLATTVVYPTPPNNEKEAAEKKLIDLIQKHHVDIISIGNGTASKESEIFVAGMLSKCPHKVEYAITNEAGASVYSASKLGAEEFPDFDVALRSAVSIARRLADPLAELIKIDVKSIGVGQYQHDMPQNRLSEVLTQTVEGCVNSVGVDLNTASPSLLTYVSGLNANVGKSIVTYREKIKKFKTREQLLSVPKLGPKAYEQCAGFLRIPSGENILDNTGVHPESYPATMKLLSKFNLGEADVKNGNLSLLPLHVSQTGEDKVAKELGIGVPTLKDIMNELLKPGRDIRDSLPPPTLRSDILSMEDLQPGMVLNGVVRNVIDFGAFVDIAVHQDGLVHISQMADHYIKHPSEVLKVGDQVKVKVISVDLPKKRIALTMKGIEE